MKLWKALGIAAGSGVAIAGAGAAWTQIERKSPVVRRYTAPIDAPSSVGELKVLHVADPHFYVGQEWMVDFVRDLASLDFDLVVSTGDNLGAADGFQLLEEAFEPLLQRPGVFVLGSNDYYSPRRKLWSSYLRPKAAKRKRKKRTHKDLPWLEMVDMFTEAGWVDLSNQSEILELPRRVTSFVSEGAAEESSGAAKVSAARRIGFIGVDDPHINRDHVPGVPANWDDPDMIRIGVTHAPYQRILNEYVSLGTHAIFAGHTHGGQLCVPGYGALVTNSDLPRAYASGLSTWGFGGESSVLHVSAGLGTSPYAPVRFACRPEVSLVTLVPRG